MQANFTVYQITLAAGLGIVVYAASAGIPDWKEFIQYLKESKFVSLVGSYSIYVPHSDWSINQLRT